MARNDSRQVSSYETVSKAIKQTSGFLSKPRTTNVVAYSASFIKNGKIKLFLILLDQEHICMLIDNVEDKRDLWLIYELCEGKTMNEHLFDVKGEFFKGERIYMVHHGQFYFHLR